MLCCSFSMLIRLMKSNFLFAGTARAIMETKGNGHFQGNSQTLKASPKPAEVTQSRKSGGGHKKSKPPPPPPVPDALVHILTTSNGSPYQSRHNKNHNAFDIIVV